MKGTDDNLYAEEEWFDNRYGGTWERSPFNPNLLVTVTQPSDPSYFLLTSGHTTISTVYDVHCYICNDPEFAQMGLPLCFVCPECRGHIAADDPVCGKCGWAAREDYLKEKENKASG